MGGPQTALGYLMPDGSIDPFRGKRNKTGDLAVMDEDGFVRVTGRTKDIIIRGGMNISPVEVDEILLTHPDIADAASVGVPDPIYGEEVVAFAVSRAGAALTETSVLAFCEAKLPLAKRPKRVMIVDALPKNDRGKGAARPLARAMGGAGQTACLKGWGNGEHERHPGRSIGRLSR